MIPLKDNIPSQTFPVVNYFLIAANAAVFIYELTLGPALPGFLERHGFIPAFLHSAKLINASGELFTLPWSGSLGTLFTSLFLHGGWLHFLSNMLYLWIFGDNVEDRMGHIRYLFFYLLCGVTANLALYFSNPLQTLPTIGASGAIAGVLGAYFILYPYARILTLVPIIIFIQFFQLPAFFFLLFWFIQQYLMSLLSTGTLGQGGVAWWAHIGGFLTGMLLAFVFQRRSRRPTSTEYWPRRRQGFVRYS